MVSAGLTLGGRKQEVVDLKPTRMSLEKHLDQFWNARPVEYRTESIPEMSLMYTSSGSAQNVSKSYSASSLVTTPNQ
jgi:hypothetical protein